MAELMPVASPPLRAVVTTVAAPIPPPPARELEVAPGHAATTPPVSRPIDREVQVQSTELLLTHPARDASTLRDDVEPLTAGLRRFHVTVTRQFLKKLDAARNGVSHTIPGATTAQVLQAAEAVVDETGGASVVDPLTEPRYTVRRGRPGPHHAGMERPRDE